MFRILHRRDYENNWKGSNAAQQSLYMGHKGILFEFHMGGAQSQSLILRQYWRNLNRFDWYTSFKKEYMRYHDANSTMICQINSIDEAGMLEVDDLSPEGETGDQRFKIYFDYMRFEWISR